MDKCTELEILPCFGYTSFSHSEAEHRFRLVFCIDEPITDRKYRDKLQNALCNAFGESDQVTKNPSRIFFGGKTLICNEYDNRIKPDEIIEKYYIAPNTKLNKNTTTKNVSRKNKSNHIDSLHLQKIEAIRSKDVKTMKKLLWGDKLYSDRKVFTLSLYEISPGTIRNPDDFSVKEPKPTICENEMQVLHAIYCIDFAEFSGIYGMVNCVLPGHDEMKPSANIFGKYI